MTGTPNQRTAAMSRASVARAYQYKARRETGCPWVYELGGFQVIEDSDGFTVWRPQGTVSVSDSTYAADLDGLSIALARMFYLHHRAKPDAPRGTTADAVRIAKERWKESK